MDLTKDILEIVGAAYTILSVIGHLPFLPKKITDFCNRIAANLK